MTSSAYACATSLQLTMPVSGEKIPLMPALCGSISRISSGPTIRMPGTPFAVARSQRFWSRGSSSSSIATISLPHFS